MNLLQRGWPVLQHAILATFVLFEIGLVNSAPATTGVVAIEISDGQVQNPVPTQAALSPLSLFKATDIAGHEIIYVGSVGLDTLGSSITELFDTAKLITTTNAAGSTIMGVAEVTTASQSTITTMILENVIPNLSSTPSILAFTSIDADGQPVVNLGQTFVRSNGSTFTAILESGISTSYLTTLNPQGSTIFETVGVFTRSNGSVVTSALSFAGKISSLALSKTTGSPSYQAMPTMTSYQTSLGTVSGKMTGSTTGAASRASYSSKMNTARITLSNSIESQSSSLEIVQNASLRAYQQSRSQRSVTLRTLPLSTNSTSLASSSQSSIMSAGILNSLNKVASATGRFIAFAYTASEAVAQNSFSSPQASSQSTLTSSTVSNSSMTASALSIFDENLTMSVSGKVASTSESTTARSAVVQAAINATANATMIMTAKASSIPSAKARSNSTISLSSAGVGGLLLAVQSDSAILSGLATLLGEQLSTITTIPPGMSVRTVTSTTCSTAFAMATTTASGSTVTQVVPELCYNGAAFFLFGWTKIPQLCSERLGLFGFFLQFICDPRTHFPSGVDIISNPPSDSPEDSTGDPEDDPEGDPEDDPQHEDDKPSNTRDSSDSASSTSSPQSVVSSQNSASLSSSTRVISFTSSPHSMASSQNNTSLASSTRALSATTMASSACSGATTVSGTINICCNNSTIIGTTTLCNYQIDSWVESLGPFVTTSIPIPASATPVLMPGTSIIVNSATLGAFFSSLASEMAAYVANLTVTTSAMSRSLSISAPTASATAATLGTGSGLLGVLKGSTSVSKAEQAPSTTSAAPTLIPTGDSNITGLVGAIQGAIDAGESTPPTSIFGCIQKFLFADDGPNSFVCQCNDDTWNHLEEDTYSLCPSQVTTISMTIAYPSTTIAPNVSCTLVNYAPSSAVYVPLCECANKLFFADECPSSVSAATITLTLSEPPASVTAALTKGDFITPSTPISSTPLPSPTTSACVPQCTKHVEQGGPQDSQTEITCDCNPACGGNAHPKPDSNNVCPNQVSVVS